LRTVLQKPGMFQMYSIVEVLPSELSEGLLLDLFESDSIERTMLTRFYTFCDEYRWCSGQSCNPVRPSFDSHTAFQYVNVDADRLRHVSNIQLPLAVWADASPQSFSPLWLA